MELIKKASNNYADKNIILKIAKFLVYFSKHKKELIKKYDSSKAEIFFQKFNTQINSSQLNNYNNLKLKFNGYILTLFFKLYYYDKLCSNEGNIEIYRKK